MVVRPVSNYHLPNYVFPTYLSYVSAKRSRGGLGALPGRTRQFMKTYGDGEAIFFIFLLKGKKEVFSKAYEGGKFVFSIKNPNIFSYKSKGEGIFATCLRTRKISTACSSLMNQAVKNLRVAYGKISPNNSRYSRNGFCMIYNSYCAPVLLFLSGMAHLFRKKDRHTLSVAYFRYYKFLLGLPRWHRNKKKIIAQFGLIDVPSRIRSSSDDLCKKTISFIHVYDPLQSFSHIDTV